MRLARVTYLMILAATALWCAGILSAPVCRSAGGELSAAGDALFHFYHPVCHQIPERSLRVLDSPLGVCARCSGIYAAFLAGLLLYPFLRDLQKPVIPSRWLLLAAGMPMLVDALWPGPVLYEVTNLTRCATGAVFGLLLPFVILPVAVQAMREIARSFPRQLEKGITDAQ
jgi:uncharacterized membrane protein